MIVPDLSPSLSLSPLLAAWSELAKLSVRLWLRPSGDKAPVLPGESPHPAGILPSPTGCRAGRREREEGRESTEVDPMSAFKDQHR